MKQINKRRKRANNEGCIRKLSDGRWEARITDGYTAEGKQHFKTFSNKKQSVVVEWLKEFKINRDKLSINNAIKYTVKDWLNIWYETYVISNVKQSTRVSYEGIIKNHLIPNIGHIKLIDLKKVDIEKMYQKLLEDGCKSYKKGVLSVKTIRNIHVALHKALQEALEREYIIKNPATIAKVPSMKSLNVKKKEIEIYSLDEEKILIEEAKKDKIYGTVIIFALYTGMRKGEILGLQWKDIDFEKRSININKQLSRLKNYDDYETSKTKLQIQYNTKTSNSTRIIPMSVTVYKLLKEQYNLQQQNKMLLGRKYENNNMVFCRQDGHYLDPDTVLAKYNGITKKSGIKKCTFHALRHTFATRALEGNINTKVVSQILGHSSVQFTLDTYTHVLSNLQIEEMKKLDNYLKLVNKQ